VIVVRSYRGTSMREHVDPDDISELIKADGELVWVDVVGVSRDELGQLEEEFSLHPLALEDACKHHQRPKLEHYPSHAFVVAYSGTLQEVDFFVGPNWLVTVREEDEQGVPWPIATARARFERMEPAARTLGFLFYVLLDELVDGYFTALEPLEEALEHVEERIFEPGSGFDEQVQADLFGMRRELLTFRRAIVPVREVLAALLRREVVWLDAPALVHLQDVYDHVLRAIDMLDSQRELLGNAVDAHLANIANRQNQVMKRMTSWGAILLGSTLIAGIYGMNFEHMPELEWPWGYPMALAFMALLTYVLYAYFRGKDWL
jgi:magnesium transporter